MTRLSHSSRERYELCPYKYYLYDIQKYRSNIEKSALVFGNCFDLALNALLVGSNNYHNIFDEEWSKYKDVTIDYYKSDLMESLLTDEERTLSINQQSYISMRRKGHRMLDAYKENIYPHIKQVISIQDRIELIGNCDEGLHTEDVITGVVDLIGVIEHEGSIHHCILDNKSTGEPYAKNSVNKKDQLPLYSNYYPDIKKAGYLTINKKNFKTQIIIDDVDQERKEEVLTKFVNMLHNINEGNFPKNKKGCFSFGKRCEFYSFCHSGSFSKDIYKKENK